MRKEEKQNHSRMTRRMIKRMSAGTLTAMIICTSLTGCSVPEKFADKIPFLKEEESTEPRYLVDTEYKQKMDEFVSVADVTVKTAYGNVAVMTLPERMRQYTTDHQNKSSTLKESVYLAEYSENKENTDPVYIVHFAYAKDIGNIESLCEAMVLETGDVPQSILSDSGNALHTLFDAKEEPCDLTVPYLDETTESVRKFSITERSSAVTKKGKDSRFSTVYVFPYNGGYIFCECYAFKDRTIDTPFYDETQAARNDINDRVINQAFKESIAREKNKTFDDGQDITVEDSDRKMESLISEIYLTVKNPDKEEQEEKKDAGSYINEIVKYIPVYKPENYLYIPEFKNFNASMQANGYGYKKEDKKIKKSKGKFEDWSSWGSREYKNTKAECLQFVNTMEDVSKYSMTEKEYNALEKKKLKNQKKYYNKYVKKLTKEYGEDAGYEVQQKKGQNFTVTIGLNKKENRMWAAYLFEDYIFSANGDIRPVIQFMNLIPYGTQKFDYKALDAEKQGIEED